MSQPHNRNASLILDRSVERGRGAAPAYLHRDETVTYEQLRRRVNRMGRLLRELGVRREQRVLLVLDNTPAFPVAFLGALRVGAVPVPVSNRESAENFRHFVEDSYAELVVCDAEMLAPLQRALGGSGVRFATPGGGEDAVDLDAGLAAQEDELEAIVSHPDDMAFWLYTSGSTGKPKGVVHVHASIEVTCQTFARQVLDVRESDRLFSTTKLHHAYGLGNGLSFPLHFGAGAVLLDGAPTPDRLAATLREHAPTVYFSVPALYKQLAEDPDAAGALDSVRLCVSAAEPLPAATFERWRERFGIEIVDCIGSTEMLQAYCSNTPGAVVAGTTGRPVPGYDLRLLDEDGTVIEGAGTGAMEVRGDSCAAFYWHQRAKSRKSMRGEWFASGDLFTRHEDGTYAYVGRSDDMFKVGGLWVSPIDMEAALLEHPAVAGAGVVGVVVEDYSRIAAFVQCADGFAGDDALRDELRSWCRLRMREHEYPHLIRFVEELPRTLTGKPQRFKLRERIERETQTAPTAAQAPRERADLSAQDGERAALELVLSEMAGLVGETSSEALDPDRTFAELGFDSLSSFELRNRLANASGLSLASTLAFDHPTPRAAARAMHEVAQGLTPRGRDDFEDLTGELERVSRPAPAPRMPPVELPLRLKTSALWGALLPASVAVARARRVGERLCETDPHEREHARAAMETVVAGTAREGELDELVRAHLVERNVDRALFWQRPWSAHVEEGSRQRLREALADGRGVLLSACHLGPYHHLQSAGPLRARRAYLVPGDWFFAEPTPDLWGRRLARWRRGTPSLLVPASGSFRLIAALLERGEAVTVFFDMPGPRQTRFLGKPAMLADGTAQLSVRTGAPVLPLRARRDGHRVQVQVGEALEPARFAGADELHEALAAVHERWILQEPAAMEDPREIGWRDGATPQAWVAPGARPLAVAS